MLSVVERMGLLDEVEVLSSQRDYVALDELLSSSDPIIVASDPILRYYRTLAKLQIGEMTEAFDFGYNDIQFFARHQDARVYRRYLNVLGILLTHSGRLDEAVSHFTNALALATSWDDTQLAADATMNLGVVADIQGRWADALASHMRALSNFLELSDRPMVAGCYHNIGMTFRQLGMLKESQSRFELALEILETYGTRSDVAATALEKSLLYVQMGEFELAEAIAKVSYVEIKSGGNKRLIGEALRVLGMIKLSLGKTMTGRRYLHRAHALSIETGNVLLQAESAEALAKVLSPIGLEEESALMRATAAEIYQKMGSAWRLARLGGSNGGS